MKKTNGKLDQPLFVHSNEFLSDYLLQQLGRSVNTISSYRNCMRLLKDFIEEVTLRSFYNFRFVDTTRDFILNFLVWIESRGCCKATRNQRLACIKTYAKFVMDLDFEMSSWGTDILSIPMTTAEKPMVGWLREEVLESILKQPDSSRKGIRDSTLMVLMYETGARVSELINLRLRSLNLFDSGSSVRLHGKGDKTREVPIGDKATKLFETYLQLYHSFTDNDADDFVFYTVIHGTRNQMSIGNVERIVKKYASEARKKNPQVPERVTPHNFRHSRASHMLRAKVPLPLIGRFLGHVSLETTNIYNDNSVFMTQK